MKTITTILLTVALSFLCGACEKNGKEDGGKQETGEFVPTSWNGRFLQAISDAYGVFLQTDEMPVYVNVDGIKYTQAKYFSAACDIMALIEAHPKDWQDYPDVEIPKYSSGNTMGWNTFEQTEISMDALKWMIRKMDDFAKERQIYPNYCCFAKRNWKNDHSGDSTMEYYYNSPSEEYVGNLIFPQALVIMARVMDHYKNNHALPEKVSSFWSDFLRSAKNCPVDDELVVATMREASAGKITEREKAEAIFLYARDKWNWENYSNTRKGALKTIMEKGGNCCDMTHAVVAMCRAAGIPARYIHGQCYFSSGVIGHVIPDIYVDGEWFICDPTNKNATFGNPVWKGMETFNGLYKELPF